MMLVDNRFELEIPTHIAFTLYKNDYIDNLIISKVKKECKNQSKRKNEFIVSLEGFQSAIHKSTFLRAELKKTLDQDLLPNPNFKPNSLFFLQSIINRLHNLSKITFKISDEKVFSRLVKVDGGREIVSFHFNIIEGTFDLTQILDREQLDTFNKRFMDVGLSLCAALFINLYTETPVEPTLVNAVAAICIGGLGLASADKIFGKKKPIVGDQQINS